MQREMSMSGQEKLGLSESSPLFTGDYDLFESLYPSIFQPIHSPLVDYYNDGSSITSSLESDDAQASSCFLPQLQQQVLHQDLIDRHRRVLSQLNDVAHHAQILRQENVNLKMTNRELNNRLNLMLNVPFPGVDLGPRLDSVVDGLRKLGFGAEDEGTSQNESVSVSPTSVMDSGFEGGPDQRVQLPKSISVRSSGYLKAARAGGSSGKGGDSSKASNENKFDNETQKVYLKGSKKEKAVELEVYNQGMIKTELCNKWQQTGTCPYGDNCQFAHGVDQLRPVIRHPRYKTEVCRMVLNNTTCPYGHRCHFRHALTDEEKLTKDMNSNPLEPIMNYR